MVTKQTDPNALIGRLIESRAVQGEPSAAEIADRVERCRLNRRQCELREKERAFLRAYFLQLAKSARHQGIEVLSKTDSERPVGVRIIDADDTEARKITLIKNNDHGTHDPVEQAKVMEYLRAHARDADIAHGLPWSEEEIAALADADRQMREREQEREREGAASRDESDQDQGTHAPGDWVRIEAVLTNEDAIALNDAAQLVAAESGELAHDRKVKLGQVIPALAAEYLGTGRLTPQGLRSRGPPAKPYVTGATPCNTSKR